MIALNFKGNISLSFQGKHIIWVLGAQNWKLPTQLISFLDFWAKILRIAHPVNYSYLYTSYIDSCSLIGQNYIM